MAFDFGELTATTLPSEIEMPKGLRDDADYIFSVTYTDPDAMEVKEFAEATERALKRDGKDLGTYPPPLGHEGLRQFIATQLAMNRGITVDTDNIFLSSGVGGACQTVIDAFIDPGDLVLMEEYCYHGSLNMFLKKGAKLVHVEMDEDGILPGALEDALVKASGNGVHPKMIYTIPVYHNPTGVTLSLERREKLVEISTKYGVPIVENESYADFRIDGPLLPPALMGLHPEDGVIYLSGFTKLLGCGLRIGFGAFPEAARESLQRVGFGVSPSHMTSMAVHEYLKDNRDDYVSNVANSLKGKRDALIRALGEYFPPSCEWTEPNGGMMVWVQLPEGSNTWDALEKAVERGVKYNPGPVFRADRSGNNRLRLTYSHNSPKEIEEGIAILADVFEKEGFFKDKR